MGIGCKPRQQQWKWTEAEELESYSQSRLDRRIKGNKEVRIKDGFYISALGNWMDEMPFTKRGNPGNRFKNVIEP